jgi:LPXTG-motif cell wall-anchored protein
VREQAWQLTRTRTRSVAVVTLAVLALVLVLARPASAHTPSVTGTTSCPDGTHHVAWTINNDQDASFGPMKILSAKATVNGTDYGVSGYDQTVPPAGSTHAATTVPGAVTGTVHIVLHVLWPQDNFDGHTSGDVELQSPCNETSTSTASTTSTPPNSGTAPESSTTGPPVSGATTPTTAGGSPGGIEAGASTTAGGGVQGEEAGSGTLPRTGAPSTNWALVGFASLAFGAALLLVARRPARLRRP